MSFKRCLSPQRQATNELQVPYIQPASPRAGLAGQPIARRVETLTPFPSPCGLPFQIVLPLLGKVANGASNTASRTRLALPPRHSPRSPTLDSYAQAPSCPLACTAWLVSCALGLDSGWLLFDAWTPVFSLTSLPVPRLPIYPSPFMCSPPCDFPVAFLSLTSDCAPFPCLLSCLAFTNLASCSLCLSVG